MLDVLFVQNYYEQMLGIMQISAVLKQHGFTTDVAIGTKESITNKAVEKKPAVVGFYCTTGFHHRNLAAAAEIKKNLADKTLTIFGGPHPTFVPEMIESEPVDVICRGEGEYAVLELVQALRAGADYSGIKNLTVKKNGRIYENQVRELCDVNTLPMPDREIYRNIKPIYNNKRQEVMFGRGCPFDCTFCSTHAFRRLYRAKGSYTRLRSVDNVMKELQNTKSRYNPSCFFFHDDTFFFNRDYCIELLRTYKERINLPFACLIRADLATEELIKLLKSSGCYLVSFGIESGNEKLRNLLLKKHLSDEQILKCAALLHKYRIPFATFNMAGLPGETLEQLWDTVDINTRVKPAWAWFSVYQALPQTELAQYAIDNGCIDSIEIARSDASFHENSNIIRNNPQGKRLLRLKNNANIVVKFPFLRPVVKNVFIKLPLDELYGLTDKLLYFVFYYSKLTYKESFLRVLRSAFFMLRRLKEFK